MGKDVLAASGAARAVFAEADAALGEPLSTLCSEGPMDKLTLTANTQPAILATSMAILAALRERYPRLPTPQVAAGHSLGEYSALCAAGALDLTDAVKICRIRGAAMQEAVPAGHGGMAAVMGVEDELLGQLCEEAAGELREVVSPANFNAPGQTVIAGHHKAVGRVAELVTGRGGKVIPLKVSAPFHCALMAPVRAPLGDALRAAQLRAGAFPVLANVDAAPKADADAIRLALVAQVDSPVQWVRTIRQMRAEGVTHALEIGPGRVLSGLCKRIDRELSVLSVNGQSAIEKVSEFIEMD
jgi:[acyl-carrier-protein] S-malonyltransferase